MEHSGSSLVGLIKNNYQWKLIMGNLNIIFCGQLHCIGQNPLDLVFTMNLTKMFLWQNMGQNPLG